MTELDRAIAAALARELRAVYDHVEVVPPAPSPAGGAAIDPMEGCRVVVWHRGSAGTCTLAVVVLHPAGLVLCLGPRHHQDWSRVETIPYGYPGAVARILALLATVVV